MDEYSKNRNKEIFDSLVGKEIESVEYSDLRDGEDYVTLKFSDGTSVIFHSKAPNTNDITWIEAKRA